MWRALAALRRGARVIKVNCLDGLGIAHINAMGISVHTTCLYLQVWVVCRPWLCDREDGGKGIPGIYSVYIKLEFIIFKDIKSCFDVTE